jgi:hypothetical protein
MAKTRNRRKVVVVDAYSTCLFHYDHFFLVWPLRLLFVPLGSTFAVKISSVLVNQHLNSIAFRSFDDHFPVLEVLDFFILVFIFLLNVLIFLILLILIVTLRNSLPLASPRSQFLYFQNLLYFKEREV